MNREFQTIPGGERGEQGEGVYYFLKHVCYQPAERRLPCLLPGTPIHAAAPHKPTPGRFGWPKPLQEETSDEGESDDLGGMGHPADIDAQRRARLRVCGLDGSQGNPHPEGG